MINAHNLEQTTSVAFSIFLKGPGKNKIKNTHQRRLDSIWYSLVVAQKKKKKASLIRFGFKDEATD